MSKKCSSSSLYVHSTAHNIFFIAVSRGLSSPTKLELLQLVKITKVCELGLALGIGESNIEIVQADYPNDRKEQLSKVFSLYLQLTEDPSWLQVIEALHKIGENRCAKEVMDHFGKIKLKFVCLDVGYYLYVAIAFTYIKHFIRDL